ncbi:hypothetical protein Tco_0356357 [Tanacetum coccineum]
MFGNQFICNFELEANLDIGMVLHQGYLLGGSYHRHDLIFLLNCYEVRWQVEVKQTYVNATSVVRPVWSDFVSKNITQDVKCLHFIEEGEDISRRAQTLPLVFVPNVYSTSQPDSVDLFIKDRECKERLLRLVRITPPTCYGIQIIISDKNQRISKGFVDRHKLRGYDSAVVSHMDKKFEFKLCKKSKTVEMFSTTTLRDMVRSSFWRGQWVRFYLSKDTSLEDGVVRFEVC